MILTCISLVLSAYLLHLPLCSSFSLISVTWGDFVWRVWPFYADGLASNWDFIAFSEAKVCVLMQSMCREN